MFESRAGTKKEFYNLNFQLIICDSTVIIQCRQKQPTLEIKINYQANSMPI